VECENKSDTSNKRGNWNPLKIIQKIPEQSTGKPRYDIKELNKTATLGTAHTAGSAGVKMFNIN